MSLSFIFSASNQAQFGRVLRLVKLGSYQFFAVIFFNVFAIVIEGMTLLLIAPILNPPKPGEAATWLSNIPFSNWLGQLIEGKNQVELLKVIAVLFVIAALIRGISLYLRNYIARRFELTLTLRLRDATFSKMLETPLLRLKGENMSKVINVLISFSPESAAVAGRVAAACSAVLQLGFYFGMILLLSWELTLVAVTLLAICSFSVQKLLARRIEVGGAVVNQNAIDTNQSVYEAILGIQSIRSTAREHDVWSAHLGKLRNYIDAALSLARNQARIEPLISTSVLVIVAGLMLLGSIILTGEDQIARLLLLLMFLSRFLGPVSNLNEARAYISAYDNSARLVFEFLDDQSDTLTDGKIAFAGLDRAIRFEDVTFQYPGADRPAVDELSFTIPCRKTTAIVGASGSGKTTVMALLLRLFDPADGSISIDDHDLRDLTVKTWRHRVGVVLQDTWLFNATIRDNIRFTMPEADDAQLEAAARLANASQFIAEQPQGYDTIIGDRGANLSGGQQQRLAIARALLPKPDILLLDEATSSLDSDSERNIRESVRSLAGTMTIVIVAHRLATVQAADQIVVLDKGKVIETGSHTQLMALGGAYRRLVEGQMLTGS